MKTLLYICSIIMVITVSATTAQEIKGVVERGYANATYWKVKPCILDKRSLELNQTCPLIAIPTAMDLKSHNPDQAIPVTLKCANTENGTFELIQKTKRGLEIFLQVTYKDKKLGLVSSFDSEQGREGGDIWDYTKNIIVSNLKT